MLDDLAICAGRGHDQAARSVLSPRALGRTASRRHRHAEAAFDRRGCRRPRSRIRPREVVHLSNSAATVTRPDTAGLTWFGRGIAIYGLSPVPELGGFRFTTGDDAASEGDSGEEGSRRRGRLLRASVGRTARHHSCAASRRLRRRFVSLTEWQVRSSSWAVSVARLSGESAMDQVLVDLGSGR